MFPEKIRKYSLPILGLSVLCNLLLILNLSPLKRAYYRLKSGDMFSAVDQHTNYRRGLFTLFQKKSGWIFLGDSHIEKGQWSEWFGSDCRIYNFGVGKDTAQGLIDRLSDLQGIDVEGIFLLIGINDLFLAKIPEETAKVIKESVISLKNSYPNAKMMISTIPPLNHTFYRGDLTQDKVNSLNELIIKMATDEKITLIDWGQQLPRQSDGNLDPDFTFDGIHLKANGYKILLELLKQQGVCAK